MQYITFGKTNLNPSKLGIGCSQIASLSTKYTPAEVRATLREAFNEGINFFDTADIYGQGDSERILGKLFRKERNKVIFCTKAGLSIGLSQNIIKGLKPFVNPLLRRWEAARQQTISKRQKSERCCFEPEYLNRQIVKSLKHLQTDYLDIFLLHSPQPPIITNNAVFNLLEKLKGEGIIRFYGISCKSTHDATAFMNRGGIDILQVPVNLLNYDRVKQILSTAQQKGIAVISREPFGSGSLFQDSQLREFCSGNLNISVSQIALKFLAQRDETGVILAGMTCRRHLYENIGSISESYLTVDKKMP